MFERFTDRARRVVVLAQEETRLLGHTNIGTEHLLLGIIHEGEGVGARTLESLGLALESVREQIEALVGPGGAEPSGHIPFTPGAKMALELALRASFRLGHHHLGTEHLLLGVIELEDDPGAQVLLRQAGSLDRVREAVLDRLGQEPARPERVPVGPAMGFGISRAGVDGCPHPSEELRWEPVDVPGPAGERAAAVVRCGACDRAIGILRAD